MKLWKPLAAATAAALATGLMVAPAGAVGSPPGIIDPPAPSEYEKFMLFHDIADDLIDRDAVSSAAQTAATMKVSYVADGIRATVTVSGDLVKIARSARVATPGLRPVTVRSDIICTVASPNGFGARVAENCVTKVGRTWYHTTVRFSEVPTPFLAWGDNSLDGRSSGWDFMEITEMAFSADADPHASLRLSPFDSAAPSATFSGSAQLNGNLADLLSHSGKTYDGGWDSVTVALRSAARVAPTRNGMRWDYSYTGKYTDVSSPELLAHLGGPKHSGKVTITSSARPTRIAYPSVVQKEWAPDVPFDRVVRIPLGFGID